MLSSSYHLQPHLVKIDAITLAVFEDSGWYGVNFDFCDKFLWGKGLFNLNVKYSLIIT